MFPEDRCSDLCPREDFCYGARPSSRPHAQYLHRHRHRQTQDVPDMDRSLPAYPPHPRLFSTTWRMPPQPSSGRHLISDMYGCVPTSVSDRNGAKVSVSVAALQLPALATALTSPAPGPELITVVPPTTFLFNSGPGSVWDTIRRPISIFTLSYRTRLRGERVAIQPERGRTVTRSTINAQRYNRDNADWVFVPVMR